MRSVMLPKDYVRFRLTGDKAIDMADASGTLLLDVAHRRWSSEMLDAAEIDARLLPDVSNLPMCADKYRKPEQRPRVSRRARRLWPARAIKPRVRLAWALYARGGERHDRYFRRCFCRDRSSRA